ncbi:hypothetical protein GOP47_0005144 [Adiantum capillus-veneris]|uniref:SHSP domain-containing protein n=1 Tax=Adiantum capillus-veneris TaxID=13818 RepID=A0A9D4V4K0_ADICA|nr:hypothetical protein GOP47_0005144 [Adiantum capillus-veneris]
MSLDAASPLGEGAGQAQQQLLHQGAEISSLSNPITTPSCSVPGSHKSSSVSSRESSSVSSGGSGQPATASLRTHSHPPTASLSPKLTVRTPLSSTRNSLLISTTPIVAPPPRSPSRSTTPKSQASTTVRTPIRDQSPRIPSTTPHPHHHHHPPLSFSRSSTRRSSIHSYDGTEKTSNITSTPLSSAVSHILSSRPTFARACCHLCPNPAACHHVCADPRTCSHVGPRTASRELRCIKPPPPASFDSYVRPESLHYSTCNSACETPRSSTSSSSFISLPAGRRLYSRPPTPAPLIRAKEVHRIAMAGVPVDVKELANCYLFVAEIPGLKNTEVKVQVENDSILKISGERRREECEECEIKYIRVERQAGRFTRKFNLPANADLENITAACQDGLLSVVVPKNPPPEQRRPKNFDVKIAT